MTRSCSFCLSGLLDVFIIGWTLRENSTLYQAKWYNWLKPRLKQWYPSLSPLDVFFAVNVPYTTLLYIFIITTSLKSPDFKYYVFSLQNPE